MPEKLLTDEQKRKTRKRSDLIALILVSHAWGVIFTSAWLASVFPSPFLIVLLTMLIGSRQLGLLILMHDASHGILFESSRLNYIFGQWFCGLPMLADMNMYRSYHLAHHKYVLPEKDPDLVLTGHYPISRVSLSRKFLRDISGRSGLAQRSYQIKEACTGNFKGALDRINHFWNKIGRSILCNFIVFSLMSLVGT